MLPNKSILLAVICVLASKAIAQCNPSTNINSFSVGVIYLKAYFTHKSFRRAYKSMNINTVKSLTKKYPKKCDQPMHAYMYFLPGQALNFIKKKHLTRTKLIHQPFLYIINCMS